MYNARMPQEILAQEVGSNLEQRSRDSVSLC